MIFKNIFNRKKYTFPVFCLIFFINVLFFSCKNQTKIVRDTELSKTTQTTAEAIKPTPTKTPTAKDKVVRNSEARDDVQQYNNATVSQSRLSDSIAASVETQPVKSLSPDVDAADDPAIWYNTDAPEKSVIFGSNKRHGIHSYDLSGKQLQYIPCGSVNNIDIRKAVRFGGEELDILAGSCRSDNSIVIFVIDKNGKINETPDYKVSLNTFSPYGFCLYKTENQELNAFVNNKLGFVQQISIDAKDSQLISKKERELKLATQVEGMVADDITHTLYVGEEQTGIHIFSAKGDAGTKGNLLAGSTRANKKIRHDIEGLALLPPHYLVASSQGNFSYAIFDIKNKKYINSFFIKKGKVDGVEETDGLEIIQANFGTAFPNGLLVVQDGFNFDNKEKKAQNFKLVDLREVVKFLE